MSPRPASPPPTAVRRAGVIVMFEGLVAVVAAVVFLVIGFGAGKEATFAFGGTYWFALIGIGVFAGGWALFTGRRWGRAVAVVTQILLAPVGFALLTDSGRPWIGAPLLVVVVLVLGLLFSPSAVRWSAADYAPDTEPVDDGIGEPPAPRRGRPRRRR
ncbi:hypothetical protein [Williamsia sterculiae]|uniref:Integral membrane protein n=1 Tax=Williamsia sterculiae TaxID=1344003 RepID=A0A1N7FYM2_9NOCA|nr:hypothetical protein [Williamsia sterculiae]SIS05463.1 hypothetical protein SAMN05445060_2426 [Williamsia sterculiae]